MSEARAVPFFCPYCGEEDLEPAGEHGGWACRACLRIFQLRLEGVGVSELPTPTQQ